MCTRAIVTDGRQLCSIHEAAREMNTRPASKEVSP
jgi:hypothetical protein